MTYSIARYPQRKQACLMLKTGNTSRPIAYFKRDTDAVEFMKFVDAVAGLTVTSEWHGWSIKART